MRRLVRLFAYHLSMPSHTAAYHTGHDLDKALAALLETHSGSDYGHSGLIFDAFKEAIIECSREEL